MTNSSTDQPGRKPLPLGSYVASVSNDITLPMWQNVMSVLDDTLIQQGQGKSLKLYDDLERDTHVYSVLTKRKQKLIGREWIVKPGGDAAEDIAAADYIRDVLDSFAFDQLCKGLLDATLKGFSVAELCYAPDGRHMQIDKFKDQDQRRFAFDRKGRLRLLTQSAPVEGIKLHDRKFVVHRFDAKGNNAYGLGLGTRLFWPVLFKKKGAGFWLKFLERFAMPIPVGKYPVGSLPASVRELQNTLDQMNVSSSITVPIGTELESFESQRSGTVDNHDWQRFWNTEISKAVTGETLTTEMGKNGARAASETHADILDALIDSDSDLLSGTLNSTIVRWLCEYSYPSAKPPTIWRPRPANQLAEEELATKRAERQQKELEAVEKARGMGYEPADLDGHMEGIFGGPVRKITLPKKKVQPDPAFAEADELTLPDLIKSVERAARKTHTAWVLQIAQLVNAASSAEALSAAMIDWWAELPRPAYVEALGDAIALAELVGRGEVLDEIDGAEFAEPTVGTVTFKEAQEFLRQKVSLPTNVWTDTLHHAHDRAFVVAGADSVALVEDLRGALDRAINEGGGLEAFRRDFDDIVARNGWQYKGGRNWRTRVIYDTNLRAAHQAGRLKQMRDPAILERRPYWQYRHAETRDPKIPRDEHLAWDGKVWRHDDPIWDYIYPPNGWKCSCGVASLSAAGMKRLGKEAPDPSPRLKMRKVKDPTTGEWVEVPQGIDFGWGYQPGDTWERGLVPRELQKPLSLAQPELPLPVVPSLSTMGRSFASPELPSGKDEEFYVSRFLSKFGASVGQGVMYRDKSGQAVIISDQLFRNADGAWKAMKRDRAVQFERLAEVVFDPDEIWVDWGLDQQGHRRLLRRYLRWDPLLAGFGLFEWSAPGWSGLTSFDPRAGKRRKPSLTYLEKARRGALIYRRE